MKVQKSKGGCIHLLQLAGGGTWSELLTEIGEYAEVRELGKKGLIKALIERETDYPTGLKAAVGVAIPHAEQVYTEVVSMVVVTLDEPVMFRQMGSSTLDVPVKVVFLLLLQSSARHLDLLGAISRLIQKKDGMMRLINDDLAIDMLSADFDEYLM